jgi:hypothetical protein
MSYIHVKKKRRLTVTQLQRTSMSSDNYGKYYIIEHLKTVNDMNTLEYNCKCISNGKSQGMQHNMVAEYLL